MRKFVLILVGAALLLAWAAAPAWAAEEAKQVVRDCSDWKFDCIGDKGNGHKYGKVSVGACWQWKYFGCWPCRLKEAAQKCNEKYSGCKGKCYACNKWDACCLDTHGIWHNCAGGPEGGPKLRKQ